MFATIEKKDYQQIIMRMEMKRVQHMVNFFASIPLFSSVSEKLLQDLHHSMEKKVCLRA